MTSQRRCNDVPATLCVCWVGFDIFFLVTFFLTFFPDLFSCDFLCTLACIDEDSFLYKPVYSNIVQKKKNKNKKKKKKTKKNNKETSDSDWEKTTNYRIKNIMSSTIKE